MVTGHVFIATSLDGFIARDDGSIEWLLKYDASGEDHGYNDFIKDIDAIIMGRGTFETVREMRPWFYTRPVLVLSATLVEEPVPAELADKVRFTQKSPQQAMAMLKAEGCRRVYVDGGRVIQSFLQESLISELVITRIPILLGSGRPLFGPVSRDVHLKHVSTRPFPSGLVQSTYVIAR
ncbi:dihydrofolate reductase [Agrobacterium rhizogenes]|nr:dihydrofolate reductase [Rhizobium rhizogenes]NTJ77547.1 dihydrofolate reductase [Rhizobium rhizogenes]